MSCKVTFESIIQFREYRLVYKVSTENDIDKILQLLELPKSRRDPMAVRNIKGGLVIREFHFKRQEQL
jgi:hypothetical protein